MDFASQQLPTLDEFNFALLVLRIIVGVTLAAHGYQKIFLGGRLEGTAGWFESIGMRPGYWHSRAAAAGEIASGLCLAAGFLTSFAGLGFVGLMFTAFWAVHRGNGLYIIREGWEYVLVLGTIGVTVAILGAGEWSLDNVIGIDLNGLQGLGISLGGGLIAAGALTATTYKPAPAQPRAEAADEPASEPSSGGEATS